jgi:hypothetical protein
LGKRGLSDNPNQIVEGKKQDLKYSMKSLGEKGTWKPQLHCFGQQLPQGKIDFP